MTVAAFYKFSAWPDYANWTERIYGAAQRRSILGTVLIAAEGVNGTVCGEADKLDGFLSDLRAIPGFEDLQAKFSGCEKPPFHRLRVRKKKEIVSLGVPGIDPLQAVGEYVKPEDWNELISRPGMSLVDVRNAYEVKMGSFEGAIDPETADFRHFPEWLDKNLPDKSAPVAMFCTGGIRCEKATALLLQRGYENVYHLQGGILNYLAQVPKEQSAWHGDCYIFDQRGALDHDLRPAGPNHQDKRRGVS